MSQFITTPEGRRIAVSYLPATTPEMAARPGVVFLHGLKSDMNGSKAQALADWAARSGRALLRFDCSGHGASAGKFEEGAIGDWFEDARAAIRQMAKGPQVLVGSSMGGWLALLIARDHPELVAGLITVAGAPDFTEDGYWAGFTALQKKALEREGYVDLPSGYDVPYRITRRLIEEGRRRLILRTPLKLPFPVRFLQGADDSVVSPETARRLFDHAEGPDIRLTFVKGADHGFSRPGDLRLIEATIAELQEAAFTGMTTPEATAAAPV